MIKVPISEMAVAVATCDSHVHWIQCQWGDRRSWRVLPELEQIPRTWVLPYFNVCVVWPWGYNAAVDRDVNASDRLCMWLERHDASLWPQVPDLDIGVEWPTDHVVASSLSLGRDAHALRKMLLKIHSHFLSFDVPHHNSARLWACEDIAFIPITETDAGHVRIEAIVLLYNNVWIILTLPGLVSWRKTTIGLNKRYHHQSLLAACGELSQHIWIYVLM